MRTAPSGAESRALLAPHRCDAFGSFMTERTAARCRCGPRGRVDQSRHTSKSGHTDAAKLIGVSADTLEKWEARDVLPAPRVLDAVETYLGLCFVRWTRARGIRLKAWRKARGLAQFQAARRIGVCLETVTKLEKGRLTIATLEFRGRIFGVTADEQVRRP